MENKGLNGLRILCSSQLTIPDRTSIRSYEHSGNSYFGAGIVYIITVICAYVNRAIKGHRPLRIQLTPTNAEDLSISRVQFLSIRKRIT